MHNKRLSMTCVRLGSFHRVSDTCLRHSTFNIVATHVRGSVRINRRRCGECNHVRAHTHTHTHTHTHASRTHDVGLLPCLLSTPLVWRSQSLGNAITIRSVVAQPSPGRGLHVALTPAVPSLLALHGHACSVSSLSYFPCRYLLGHRSFRSEGLDNCKLL